MYLHMYTYYWCLYKINKRNKIDPKVLISGLKKYSKEKNYNGYLNHFICSQIDKQSAFI